jgi:hypothetical protein
MYPHLPPQVQKFTEFGLTPITASASLSCSQRKHTGSQYSGGVAQLGERLNGIQEVRGSIPLASIVRSLKVV